MSLNFSVHTVIAIVPRLLLEPVIAAAERLDDTSQ